MSAGEEAVRAAFASQAGHCDRLGSPFTALLCRVAEERIDRTTAIGRRMLAWPGEPSSEGDSVPLRLAGGLHALVRRGRLPGLAALYPPHPLPDADADALGDALVRVLAESGDELYLWLDHPPQTNETARSAVLMAGYAVIAARTRRPIDLMELGASAGLNLQADRFDCRLGERRYGDPASSVRLQPGWTGPSPPETEVRIVRRRGVDLAPLDPTRAEDRERLSAYIWPDQAERVARMAGALGIAQAHPVRVDRADAAAWVEAALAEPGDPAAVRVVAHSIAFQYFPKDTQERIASTLRRCGEAGESPLAWLRYEGDPSFAGRASLRLSLWPGREDEVLAVADHHARQVEWRAQE